MMSRCHNQGGKNMSGERPNLDLARAYTRAVGPTAIAVGAAIALQGLFLLPTVVAQ